ncbi:MAG: LacI family DNA-binding transcriptional regulator [Bryobacteraceae bacterium]
MKDIARDLGVSLMTVSKALRSHSDISEATRNRVLKRARELDYRPNWIARSLVTRRTYLIGLIIPDLMHSFFAEVAKGIARRFEPLGYQVVISNSDENAEAEERLGEMLLSRNVDGLIVASAQSNGRSDLFGAIARRRVPFVLIDRLPPGLDAHFVGVKDEEIGILATTHLIEQGCKRIAHLRGPAIPTGIGRLRGYRRTLAKHSLGTPPEYVISGQHSDSTGYEAMRHLLSLPNPPDGVFGYNDPVAAGAIKAVLEAGLSVPGNVAIIGAGNVHYSDLLRVPLSTVDQSSTAIGEKAADLLSECIEAGKPLPARSILIPPQLVVRESSRRSR